jgi:GNAT superfamily N-acetyltransferase
MFTIHLANLAEAEIIHQLAHQIYYPTYTGVLSDDQMEFMLERSYTVRALQESMRTDQDFYLAFDVRNPVGFMSLKNKDEDILRIEKLYLLPQTQGKGFGKELISFAKEEAKSRNKNIVQLNVNRGNKAYYFYLKMGFTVVEEIDIPYFDYILDDYVMQIRL